MGRRPPSPRPAGHGGRCRGVIWKTAAPREKLPTVTGLALALGFTSRAAMERFAGEQGGEFAALLDWARSLIERRKPCRRSTGKKPPPGPGSFSKAALAMGRRNDPDLGPITVQVEGEEPGEGEPCG